MQSIVVSKTDAVDGGRASVRPKLSCATKSRASRNSSRSPTSHSVSSESTSVTAMSKPLLTGRPVIGATESRPKARRR